MHRGSERKAPLDLADQLDFALGDLLVSPSTRTLHGPKGQVPTEPRVMQVLLCLAQEPGQLVPRDILLARCWNGAAIGDDSLNRAVLGGRRAVEQAGSSSVSIVTVAGAGYVLAIASESVHQAATDAAIETGWKSWRLGIPAPDWRAIRQLRNALAAQPRRADAWGMLSLLLRNAAEYVEAAECGQIVQECELAAERALSLVPGQSLARSALIGLPPLFGEWRLRRTAIIDALTDDPNNIVARHDLAILEMATGRPSAAIPLVEALITQDRLAAIFHYKWIYHLWTRGELGEMDQVADRAMHLWPRHPAIWFARLWSLAFTGRPRQAAQQLEEDSHRPDLSAPALDTLRATLSSLCDPADEVRRQEAVRKNVAAAERGAAQSVGAIIHLAGLGALDEGFLVAESYFLRRGPLAAAVRKTPTDPSITDQHRRVTQMLFIPVTATMRSDPRFPDLCEQIGLARYWSTFAIVPDHLRAR